MATAVRAERSSSRRAGLDRSRIGRTCPVRTDHGRGVVETGPAGQRLSAQIGTRPHMDKPTAAEFPVAPEMTTGRVMLGQRSPDERLKQMNAQATENYIVMEMPPQPNSCEFFGSWLSMVAKAHRFWSMLDESFATAVPEAAMIVNPRLEPAALAAVSALRPDNDHTFHGYTPNYMLAVDLPCERGGFATEFAILVQLGFFIVVDGRYQMRVPHMVTLEGVQRAMCKIIASTKDHGEMAQPRCTLNTMSKADAEAMALQLRYVA